MNFETVDGNPGRPAGAGDLLELRGRLCWLALCSGSVLRSADRQLYPPSSLWKEHVRAPGGFADQTIVFEDDLGLPRSIELVAPNGQSLFRYQVRQTTNVLGWTLPLEFYGIQYRPAETNRWEVELTVKGRVTAVQSGQDYARALADIAEGQ